MVMQAPQTRTQLTLSLLLCCGFAVTLSGCSGCQPAKPLQIGPGPNDSPPQVTEQPAEEETAWETEAFASAVGEQLHRIRDALQQADAMDANPTHGEAARDGSSAQGEASGDCSTANDRPAPAPTIPAPRFARPA